MRLIQKIPDVRGIEMRGAQIQAMAWVLMAVAVLLGLYIVYTTFGKSRIAKEFHSTDAPTPINVFWLVVIVFIILGLMVFAGNLPKKQMGDSAANLAENSHLFASVSDSHGAGYFTETHLVYHGQKEKVGEIDSDYGDENDYALVNAYVDFKKKAVIYESASPAGKAFMQVEQYLYKNYKHPVNIKWRILPSRAYVQFDDEDGTHRFVCFVNDKKQNVDKSAKVIDYETGALK